MLGATVGHGNWTDDWTEEEPVFSVACPRHGADVLLGPDAIVAMVATAQGIAVRWRCTCGYTGLWWPGGTPRGEEYGARVA